MDNRNESAADGEEQVFFWHSPKIILSTEDGPRVVPHIPAPFIYGRKRSGEPANLYLDATRYLFTQSTFEGEPSIREALEWFVREAWWTEAKLEGPIVVRLVREDGKTALQVIRKLQS